MPPRKIHLRGQSRQSKPACRNKARPVGPVTNDSKEIAAVFRTAPLRTTIFCKRKGAQLSGTVQIQPFSFRSLCPRPVGRNPAPADTVSRYYATWETVSPRIHLVRSFLSKPDTFRQCRAARP